MQINRCKYRYIYMCVCVCIAKYYSMIKKNDILLFTKTWINLEGIMLTEISQKEKDKRLYDLTYM